MSKLSPSDMPGTIAILGLLKETPDQTVAEVADGLKTRFPSCRFDPSTASTGLRYMAREGRASPPRVRCTHRAPGHSRSQDRYCLTRAGVEEFDGWMHRKPIGTPALREALYGRIELGRLEDLPELIRIAREERDIAAKLFSNAKNELTAALALQRGRSSHGKSSAEESWLREVRDVLTHRKPEYWSSRSVHCDGIVSDLEEIATRAAIDFPPEKKQR